MPDVLIVEADVDTGAVLSELLAAEGYRPIQALNSDGAIQHLAANAPPCLVLLDLAARDDANALLRWMREQPHLRQLRVAVMSGWRPPERRLGEFRDYIAGVLAKPFDLHDLNRVVAEHCGPPRGP